MIQVGTKVKPFTLCNQFNEPVSLDNFHGLKKVIYFYPKDDTPGCTVQACTFGNHYEKFKQNNWVVIGISKDSVKSHEKFVKKYNLRLVLPERLRDAVSELAGAGYTNWQIVP